MLQQAPAVTFPKLSFLSWAVLTLSAIAVGVVALRYALPHVPNPAMLPNFQVRRPWLVAHAVCSSVALLVGPWQFLSSAQRRWPRAHRWAGRVYCAAIVAGWFASLPIAAHANTGAIASTAFLLLGVLWVGSTLLGYITIRRRQMQLHRQWMIRSYALTAAAITLRIYLPVLMASGVPFEITYPIVAWASWVFNLIFAEWLIRRRMLVARASARLA
jgi:uncharacterized membrane protein YozB (DUF420 family)